MSTSSTWTGGIIDLELRKAICDRRCILFAGSGLSAGVVHKLKGQSLPTWPTLLRNMMTWAINAGIPTCDVV